MKHILLPTDFSDVSTNTIDYAFHLFGNDVYPGAVEFTIFHVHNYIPPMASYPAVPTEAIMTKSELIKTNKAQLDKERGKWATKYPALIIHTASTFGQVVRGISDFVNANDVDFVVVGSYEKSGFDRWVIGLHAYDIAKETNCPVLVVPSTVQYKPLKKVVFATDFRNLENINILDPLQEVVNAAHSKFMMLHIHPEHKTDTADKEEMNEKLRTYFDGVEYSHYFLEHDDTVQGMEEFVRGFNADILSLVGQERGFFEALFHASVTKRMIIHAEVPLLILNLKKAKKKVVPKETKSFKEMVSDQLDAWKGDIEELNVQMYLGRKETENELDERRKNAKDRLHDLKLKLDKAEHVAEDKWAHFRKEINDVFGQFKKTFTSK